MLTIAAQSAVDHDLRGVATSTTQFTRSIGGTVGVAIMGVIMSGKMSEGIVGIRNEFSEIPFDRFRQLANPQALLQPEVKADIPSALLHALLSILNDAITSVFIVGIIVVLIGLLSAIFFGKTRLPIQNNDELPMPEREGM